MTSLEVGRVELNVVALNLVLGRFLDVDSRAESWLGMLRILDRLGKDILHIIIVNFP